MTSETLSRLHGRSVLVIQTNLPHPVHGVLEANPMHHRLDVVVLGPTQARYAYGVESAADIEQILSTENERQIRFNAPTTFLPPANFYAS